MAERLLHALLMQTLTLSLATLAVRALRWGAVRRFGAAASYLCWLLVPVAMLGVALPHPATGSLAIHIDVSAMAPAWIAGAPAQPVAAPSLFDTAAAAAWAAGALLLAAVLAQRQRRFERLAMPSSAATPPCLPAGAGPAVLGVWRRRIVLPLDFDTAFDAEQRRLMLLHEGVHLRRGDNAWNLLAAALLVLHWFNPIAWWAWRRLRADQETSCDAAVLRHEAPASLAAYAGALLKVQGVALAPPLATPWRSTHPLVERIRMLQRHRISSARHRAGLRIAALSILAAGVGGYALQAGASAPRAASDAAVMTAVEVRVDGGAAIAARLLTQPGETATLRLDPDAKNALSAPVEIAYTVTRLDGDRLQLDTTLRQGSPLSALASPRLITRDGEAARIGVRSVDGAHGLAVSFVPRVLVAALPGLPAVPAQPTKAVPALPPTSALPPLPPMSALPALPPMPALPAPPADLPTPPQRAL